jgi:hypothetical protein
LFTNFVDISVHVPRCGAHALALRRTLNFTAVREACGDVVFDMREAPRYLARH